MYSSRVSFKETFLQRDSPASWCEPTTRSRVRSLSKLKSEAAATLGKAKDLPLTLLPPHNQTSVMSLSKCFEPARVEVRKFVQNHTVCVCACVSVPKSIHKHHHARCQLPRCGGLSEACSVQRYVSVVAQEARCVMDTIKLCVCVADRESGGWMLNSRMKMKSERMCLWCAVVGLRRKVFIIRPMVTCLRDVGETDRDPHLLRV